MYHVQILFPLLGECGFQEASGQNMNFLSPHDAAIALGTFKLAASFAAPLVVVRVPKKTVFMIAGAIASVSFTTGNR